MILRKARPALTTKTLAGLVIVVVAAGGAIGISYPRASPAVAQSSTTTLSTVSTSSAESSSSSSSSVSSSSAFTPTASPPLFNFTVASAPYNVLIAPGDTLNYSSIVLIPRPNTLQGAAVLNNGIGSELVVLNATLPGGMYMHFFGATMIDKIYVEADAGHVTSILTQLVAPKDIAPGNYTATVVASSGTFSVNYSFTIQVVRYLIIGEYYTFQPANLNVTAGSTVYWINLSTDRNQPYDVIFTTINVHSPTMSPGPAYESFSYTFTTPGVYPYYCAYLAAMKGTITVTG